MREHGMYSWRNPWFRWSLLSLIALTVLSMLVGFVWLPSVQPDFSAQGLWSSICRAAGLPTTWSTGGAIAGGPPSTTVVLERTMARAGASDSVGRGATLGAGTTLTEDAPAGELTLSRVKQVSIPGWQRPAKKK